jgi:hypothetical protein
VQGSGSYASFAGAPEEFAQQLDHEQEQQQDEAHAEQGNYSPEPEVRANGLADGGGYGRPLSGEEQDPAVVLHEHTAVGAGHEVRNALGGLQAVESPHLSNGGGAAAAPGTMPLLVRQESGMTKASASREVSRVWSLESSCSVISTGRHSGSGGTPPLRGWEVGAGSRPTSEPNSVPTSSELASPGGQTEDGTGERGALGGAVQEERAIGEDPVGVEVPGTEAREEGPGMAKAGERGERGAGGPGGDWPMMLQDLARFQEVVREFSGGLESAEEAAGPEEAAAIAQVWRSRVQEYYTIRKEYFTTRGGGCHSAGMEEQGPRILYYQERIFYYERRRLP